MSLYDQIYRSTTMSLYERVLDEALTRSQQLRKRIHAARLRGDYSAMKKAQDTLQAHLKGGSPERKAELETERRDRERAKQGKPQTWSARQREIEDREQRAREGTLKKTPPQKKKITAPMMAAPPAPKKPSQRKSERLIVGFRDTTPRN